MPSPSDLTSLLAELAAASVDLVLVGGLAAVAQGAPVTTFDVDIVPRRTSDNLRRLVELLERHDARYRGRPGGGPLRPTVEGLDTDGHHLLMTDLGPVDVLGAIDGGRGYDELVPESLEIEIGGHPLRVLSLRAIVEAKRRSPHPKDQQVLPILEATLRRSEDAE